MRSCRLSHNRQPPAASRAPRQVKRLTRLSSLIVWKSAHEKLWLSSTALLVWVTLVSLVSSFWRPAATSMLPPLYYVGCEHRPVFYEAALARIRTSVGEKYVARQLRSASHPEPVPEPAVMSPDEKRVKLSPATRSSRLKVLTVSPDGILMVPLLPEDTYQYRR